MVTSNDEKVQKATRLLDDFEWSENGYEDKFQWLREKFGHYPDSELIQKFVEEMEGSL